MRHSPHGNQHTALVVYQKLAHEAAGLGEDYLDVHKEVLEAEGVEMQLRGVAVQFDEHCGHLAKLGNELKVPAKNGLGGRLGDVLKDHILHFLHAVHVVQTVDKIQLIFIKHTLNIVTLRDQKCLRRVSLEHMLPAATGAQTYNGRLFRERGDLGVAQGGVIVSTADIEAKRRRFVYSDIQNGRA